MTPPCLAPSGWSTSCFGADAHPSDSEIALLCAHLALCRGQQGPLFALRCAAERMRDFLAARIVSTGIVAAGVIVAATMALR